VNLNWNQQQPSKGLMGSLFGSNKGVDLDLGAFVQMKSGQKAVIQALGNAFGNLQNPPYVQLKGDDRTGSVADGEWLHINGDLWDSLQEVLIYAFIYEGAPNWSSTDGKVTLFIPNQPEIETQLTDGSSGSGMCAIARLVNQNGQLKVERINQYFKGHADMDHAFGWGFRWSAGSK
jgi:tellurite resistance protein TerA